MLLRCPVMDLWIQDKSIRSVESVWVSKWLAPISSRIGLVPKIITVYQVFMSEER